MGIFWAKFDCNFDGEYKDNKPVGVFYTFEVKRNWTYLFTNDTILVSSINHCIQNFLKMFIKKKWMYEGEDTTRLIRDDKLELVNNHINSFWQNWWNPKGLHVRNIKITHLI